MKEDIKKGLSEALRMLFPYRINESYPDTTIEPGETKEGEPDIDAESPLLGKIYDVDDVLHQVDDDWDATVDAAFASNDANSWEELLASNPGAIEDLITYGRERVVNHPGTEAAGKDPVDAFIEDKVSPSVQDGKETLDDEDIYALASWLREEFGDKFPTIEAAKDRVKEWIEDITYDYSTYDYKYWDPAEDWLENHVRSDIWSGNTPISADELLELATLLSKDHPDTYPTVEVAKTKIDDWMKNKSIKTLKENPLSYLKDYIEQRQKVGLNKFKQEDIIAMEKLLVDKFKMDAAKAKSTVANYIASRKSLAIHEMRNLAGVNEPEYNPEDDPNYIAKKQKEDDEQKALDQHIDAEEEKYMEKKHGLDEALPKPEDDKKIEDAIASMVYDMGEEASEQMSSEQFEGLIDNLINMFPILDKKAAQYAVEVYLYKNKIPIIGAIQESKMKFTNKEVMALMETSPEDIELYKKVSEKTGLSVAHLRRMAARKEYKSESQVPIGPTTRGIKQDFKAGGVGKLRESGPIVANDVGKIPLKRNVPQGALNPSQISESPVKISPQEMRNKLVKEFENTGAEDREVDAYREELRLCSDEEVETDYNEIF